MTTKIKHTPFMLPWSVDADGCHITITDAEGYTVCRIVPDVSVVETDKLARLLAKAPELRALLEEGIKQLAADWDTRHPDEWATAVRALLVELDQ